jgi:hypothetical protein
MLGVVEAGVLAVEAGVLAVEAGVLCDCCVCLFIIK